MSVPLVTHGMIGGSGSGGGGGTPPNPSCISLNAVGPDWVEMLVIPPVDLTNYVATKVLYGDVSSCALSEAGPEGLQGVIRVSGLTSGTIYVFVPVAYGPGAARAKPGNVLMATVPVNIVDNDMISLNSCGLRDIWTMIHSKVNASELSSALADLDNGLGELSTRCGQHESALEKLRAQLAVLKRKL